MALCFLEFERRRWQRRKKTYKVNYSVEGVTHLLHRLNFVYKKTKIVPGKVKPGLQRCFKALYSLIKKMKEPEDRIYFLDGTHPIHNNRPCYGWIYKGEVKTSPGNSGRKRLNLNGALNLEDMDITVLEEKTINTEAMIRLFTQLERKQPEGTIYAIMDNAPYNHSRELNQFLKKHKRIDIYYLPPYSPNLNPLRGCGFSSIKKFSMTSITKHSKSLKSQRLISSRISNNAIKN